MSDHKKKLKTPSVWEQICGVHGDTAFIDVNSNLTCTTDDCSFVRHAKLPYDYNQTTDLEDNAASSIFDVLPVECVLKIFGYLNQIEKGRCMVVSKQWYVLARTPRLWRTVNLREFVLCYGHDMSESLEAPGLCSNSEENLAMKAQCSKRCYGRYMSRIDSYIHFLIDIKPQVRMIGISFDLANDSWMARIKRLFRFVDFRQLVYADFDWHVTPVKPMWLVDGPTFRFKDVAYATRRRERFFLNFLEEFVTEMPSLRSLVIPFGWSTRAMKYLTLLPNLRNAVFKKYTVFCTPDQEVFNELANMKCLEKLLIEVWMSTTNTRQYTITSASLKYLDLSQCRGFYLQSVDLPSLEVLKIEGHTSQSNVLNAPCLFDILCKGAPKLRRINNISLEHDSSSEVEHVLRCVCPCRKHSLG